MVRIAEFRSRSGSISGVAVEEISGFRVSVSGVSVSRLSDEERFGQQILG